MLDDLHDLVRVVESNSSMLQPRQGRTIRNGEMYCPSCGDVRRMAITPVYSRPMSLGEGLNLIGDVLKQLVPSLFSFQCVQCDAVFTAIIYPGPVGPSLAVLPSCRGGLTTRNTPAAVAFYLDEAHKAQSVGANSAAIAMFRGALEHILFRQRYKTGTCGAKVAALSRDIKKGTAPKWALELDTEFLKVLKALGDGAVHPNDGDVDKQAARDNSLLAQVKETFQMLLYLVYEVPHEKNQRLEALRVKTKIFKR